jgi:uncharacterized protein (DUF1778 family)
MSKAVVHKMPLFSPIQAEEQKNVPINFRVKPSQEKHWKAMAEKLGIKDLSTFIRGAVESAIFNSVRAQDPQWQKFIEAIQPTAQKMLGHGFYDGGAEDFVAGGSERKGTPAKEFLSDLKSKSVKKN